MSLNFHLVPLLQAGTNLWHSIRFLASLLKLVFFFAIIFCDSVILVLFFWFSDLSFWLYFWFNDLAIFYDSVICDFCSIFVICDLAIFYDSVLCQVLFTHSINSYQCWIKSFFTSKAFLMFYSFLHTSGIFSRFTRLKSWAIPLTGLFSEDTKNFIVFIKRLVESNWNIKHLIKCIA